MGPRERPALLAHRSTLLLLGLLALALPCDAQQQPWTLNRAMAAAARGLPLPPNVAAAATELAAATATDADAVSPQAALLARGPGGSGGVPANIVATCSAKWRERKRLELGGVAAAAALAYADALPALSNGTVAASSGRKLAQSSWRRPPPPSRRPPPPRRPPPSRPPPPRPPPPRPPPPPPRPSPPPPHPRPPPPRPPPPRPPPPPPSAGTGGSTGSLQYKEALAASYLFYEAQRSGQLPGTNRVAWRRSAHLGDAVPGGWYDAGDYIKHSLTIAQSATFLAWGALDFSAGHTAAGQAAVAREAVQWAADYLKSCHTAGQRRFIGLISDPRKDHTYWMAPHDQTASPYLPRAVLTWTGTQAASDLLGTVAAALASASMLIKDTNATAAAGYLQTAVYLYDWGVAVPGQYARSYTDYPPDLYVTGSHFDKLMLAASWLYRATGSSSYLTAAQSHWTAGGGSMGVGTVSPYVDWSTLWGPAVVNMLGIGAQIGSAAVPGHSAYVTYMTDFSRIWREATNTSAGWSIARTPKGLTMPNWAKWGSLRYASNAAFTFLLRAQQLPAGNADRTAFIAFAKRNLDYCLGSTGRSFVVGVGTNPPRNPHHASASCPVTGTCGWSFFDSPTPNTNILTGALVGGPAYTDDSGYTDLRTDYTTNEVSLDYSAGYTAALSGLLALGA